MPSHLYAKIRKALANSGIDSPDFEARLIIKERLGLEWADIIADSGRNVPDSALRAIENDLERRLRGEPLSRIYGRRGFYGLEFELGPGTLDPRPETELIVDRALELFDGAPPAMILDLGTGTGCIVVALLTRWPESRGVAVDLSESALRTARINAKKCGVSGRLGLICGGWGGALGPKFDLVVSNPPYIRANDIPNLAKEVRNHDPILALDGGADGLGAYKNIFSDLKRLLKQGGKALLEIGAGQGEDVVRLAGNAGLRVDDVRADYAGIQRVVEISNGDK